MPINYKNYPADWPQVRAAILERAENSCEDCGIGNYSCYIKEEGHRVVHGGPFEAHAEARAFKALGTVAGLKIVVLTIAHVHDPNPMNCDPANLKALCQACHNALDAPMRARNSKKNRLAKKHPGQIEIPL